MKKYAYIFVAAMAALACTKENPSNPSLDEKPEEPVQGVEMTFGATLEQTKAGISDNKTVWAATDHISVFDGVANCDFKSKGEGVSTTFTGTASAADNYYALYPYQATASCSEGVITATVPSVQTATLGSFDPAAALMVARGSQKFEFKNVCSLIKVTVPADVTGITSIEFSGNADENIAGEVSISFDKSGLPAATGAGVKTITLKAAKETLAAGDYYIAALPNTYSQGLKLLIHYEKGMFQQAKATDALKVERSAVRPVGTVKWPEVVFIGPDDMDFGSNLEVNTAVQWMIYNVKNSAYVPFEVLNTNDKVLDNCQTIWWHYQNTANPYTAITSKDKLIASVPKCDWENVKNLITSKLNSGTGLLLTRFATHYQAVLGLALDGKGPNNCWGDAEPGTRKIEGIGRIFTAGGHDLNSHPLFRGLTNDNATVSDICLVDSGYLLSNSVNRYNVHEGWGDYVVKNDDQTVNFNASYIEIATKVGCNILAKDEVQDIVIWEFPSTETRKGKVLCIGTPLYDWHTTEGTWKWTKNSYHNNVMKITENAINYLRPATTSAE